MNKKDDFTKNTNQDLSKQDGDLHIRVNRNILMKFRNYSEQTKISQSKLLRDFIVALPQPRISKASINECQSSEKMAN